MLKPLASNRPRAIEPSALGPVNVNPAAILEEKGQFFKRARSFRMASHKSLLWKQAFYVSITYGLVIVYGFDLISTGVMLSAVSLYYLRLFNILHQKAHANHSDSIKPQWLGRAIELINIYYLPYHESSSGKLSKHETHHKAHRMNADPSMVDDIRSNPHAVFERYGLFRSFLAALFYEEVMLYLDIRDRSISKDRWLTFLVGSIAVLALLYFLGWYKFIVFATFYRVSFALSWFGFSYLFHHPTIYSKRIEPYVWDSVLKLARWFFGAGAVNSIFYHEHHHRAPQVPSEYLHLLAPYPNTAG